MTWFHRVGNSITGDGGGQEPSQPGRFCSRGARAKLATWGFTLVELLVVISIIALLISLLLPALAKAKADAEQTGCAANLNQIGVAMQEYVDESGYYPGAEAYISPYIGVGCIWIPRLMSMMGGHPANLFYCPADPIEMQWVAYKAPSTVVGNQLYAQNNSQWFWGYKAGMRFMPIPNAGYGYGPGNYNGVPFLQSSYGYNGYGAALHSPPAGLPGWGLTGWVRDEASGWPAGSERPELRAASVVNPANCIAVADKFIPANAGQSNLANFFATYIIMPAYPAYDPTQLNYPGNVHGGDANVLFCDGHVVPMPQTLLINANPLNPVGRQMNMMWNHDNAVH
jgi:prepilin-type processing-associated H-X9-DG protein/prepilin-type N-terminal cleavage/methylation domain-containing protein